MSLQKWLGWSFRPLEELSDLAILVGGVGVVSGIGGKYFFLVPVITPASGTYGDAPFSTSSPGAWTIEKGQKVLAGLNTAVGWRTNVLMGLLGMDQVQAGFSEVYWSGDAAWTSGDASNFGYKGGDPTTPPLDFLAGQHQWGYFGPHAGKVFAIILAAGVAARVGLFGAAWVAGGSKNRLLVQLPFTK